MYPNDNIPARSRMSFPAATAVSSQVSHNGMEDRNLGSPDVLCVHSQGFDSILVSIVVVHPNDFAANDALHDLYEATCINVPFPSIYSAHWML